MIVKNTTVLTDQDREILDKFKEVLKAINKEHNNEFIIEYIFPLAHPELCGLDHPNNIQIIHRDDINKLRPGFEIVGAVTRFHLEDTKQLRYKGKFLRGCEEYVKKQIRIHGPTRKSVKAPLPENEDPFKEMYDDLIEKHPEQSQEFFQEALHLLGKTASLHNSPIRGELQKWCHQFGTYYKPKLSTAEANDDRDNKITIEFIGGDDD
jgi:hypothetical protein